MKMYIFALLALILAIQGCADMNRAVDWSAKKGAEAADIELKAAEWGVCYVPSVGALRRRYAGGNQDTIAGWQLYCSEVWNSNGEVAMEIFPSDMTPANPCEFPMTVEECEAAKRQPTE